jgi:hypothetical protein
MKEYVNEHTFRDRFMRSDNYKNNFSYEGLHALFKYIEQYEDDCGEEFEFDMVGICCDYSEYDSLKDFNADYAGTPGNNCWKYETLDDIREETVVIEIPNTERFIIGVF